MSTSHISIYMKCKLTKCLQDDDRCFVYLINTSRCDQTIISHITVVLRTRKSQNGGLRTTILGPRKSASHNFDLCWLETGKHNHNNNNNNKNILLNKDYLLNTFELTVVFLSTAICSAEVKTHE